MQLPEILGMLANLAAFLGFPIAIYVFISEKNKERREREYGTYTALDDKYLDYERLCMQYPELDLYDVALENAPALSPEQKIRQYAMFDILVSLLERAFLMYEDQSDRIKKLQLVGWVEYMHDYAQRRIFQELWLVRGGQYEKRFEDYMNELIRQARQKPAAEAAPKPAGPETNRRD